MLPTTVQRMHQKLNLVIRMNTQADISVGIIWGDADEKNVDIHVHPYHSLDASTV